MLPLKDYKFLILLKDRDNNLSSIDVKSGQVK